MTVHLRPTGLTCHHCGLEDTLPFACPTCHHELSPVGQGTERIEQVVADLHAMLLAEQQVHVAINISARDLESGRFLDVLEDVDDLQKAIIKDFGEPYKAARAEAR